MLVARLRSRPYLTYGCQGIRISQFDNPEEVKHVVCVACHQVPSQPNAHFSCSHLICANNISVTCPQCSILFVGTHRAQAIQQMIHNQMVECDTCTFKASFREMMEHECEEKARPCVYANLGCPYQGSQQEWVQHTQDKEAHFDLLMQQVSRHASQLAAMEHVQTIIPRLVISSHRDQAIAAEIATRTCHDANMASRLWRCAAQDMHFQMREKIVSMIALWKHFGLDVDGNVTLEMVDLPLYVLLENHSSNDPREMMKLLHRFRDHEPLITPLGTRLYIYEPVTAYCYFFGVGCKRNADFALHVLQLVLSKQPQEILCIAMQNPFQVAQNSSTSM